MKLKGAHGNLKCLKIKLTRVRNFPEMTNNVWNLTSEVYVHLKALDASKCNFGSYPVILRFPDISFGDRGFVE